MAQYGSYRGIIVVEAVVVGAAILVRLLGVILST